MATAIKVSKEDETKNSFQFTVDNSPTLIAEYHEDAIKQNSLVVRNAVSMIWVGILLIIGSFVAYAAGLTKDLLVGTLAGSFIDIFSATILYLFNKTDKDKQIYFNNLAKMENDKKFLDLLQNINDEELRKEVLNKIVDSNYK